MKTRKMSFMVIGTGVLLLCCTVRTIAENYTVLADNLGWPKAGLVLQEGVMYGAASGGNVFKVSRNGGGYTMLKYIDTYMDWPQAGLLLSGPTLYGTTGGGLGTLYYNRYGSVFMLDTNGNNYTVLRRFDGTDAAYPRGGLVLSGQTLYGTAHGGPVITNQYSWSEGPGCVFKINTDGRGFAVLKCFGGPFVGAHPIGTLVLSGDTLYGVTQGDWTYGASGNLFRINTDGSGFAVLVSFPGDYLSVNGDLVLSGSTLYGATGTAVFKVETDGTGFTVIKRFSGSDPVPAAGLCLAGHTLYGVGGGGAYYRGTVFQVNIDGTGFAVLKEFNGTDGATPVAPLVMSGTTLYGTTEYGGSANSGVVFSLALAPPGIVTPVQSQTAELGTKVTWNVDATGTPLLNYQWFHGTEPISEVSTNPQVDLTNVQTINNGFYTVVITNVAGSLTSPPAMLNTILPVERRPAVRIDVNAAALSTLTVQCADALNFETPWTNLDTITVSAASQSYFDSSTPLPAQRFYRSLQTSASGPLPSLNLVGMVPAITLTGIFGSSVRLEYVNAIGPTDAWVTLATVPLTNSSQLYFDVSAPGQPTRLYRVIQSP